MNEWIYGRIASSLRQFVNFTHIRRT